LDATTAAARMISDPDHFFKYYPVMMAGGTGTFNVNVANPRTYFLAKKTGSQPGFGDKEGHHGATRPGFLHTKDISSFKMDIFQAPGSSGALMTAGVPMVNYNGTKDGKVDLQTNVGAMDHYVVDANADYMTTGLLTGCCFTWIVSGVDLWCTHIRPVGIADGPTLQTLVAANGHFAAALGQPVLTFGKNDFADPYGIVIGVKTNAGWKLYAQTSGDQFKTITGAWRIHPGPAVRL
jgi:hypothetical protein